MSSSPRRARVGASPYASEADLVDRLACMLRAGLTPFGPAYVATEWNYQSGMTDVLACTEQCELIAFEAKLHDWKVALHQAYRNTTFARRAFVVLPANAALLATQAPRLFEQRRVGLVVITQWGLHVLIDAPRIEDPLISPWMHEQAKAHFEEIALGRDSDLRRDSRGHLQIA